MFVEIVYLAAFALALGLIIAVLVISLSSSWEDVRARFSSRRKLEKRDTHTHGA